MDDESVSSAVERPDLRLPRSDFQNLGVQHFALLSPALTTPGLESPMEMFPPFEPPAQLDDNKADEEMFLALLKPRVRYDVEVVTKLIIYAGIAWITMEGTPILFHFTGYAP